ncbi:MAG: thioredoxin family protein [Fimbriimonadaceae bacterium]
MGKSFWIVAAFLLAAAVVVGMKRSPEPAPPEPAPVASARPKSEAAPSLPTLVEIGSESCIPCQAMQPVLAELRRDFDGRLRVLFYDVRVHPEVAQRFGIESIPTQVFLDKNGKELFRHVGFWPKEEIVAKFKELGVGL